MNPAPRFFLLVLPLLLLSCSVATARVSPGRDDKAEATRVTDFIAELAPGYQAEEVAARLNAVVVGQVVIGERFFLRLKGKSVAKIGKNKGGAAGLNSLADSLAAGSQQLPAGLLSLEKDQPLNLDPLPSRPFKGESSAPAPRPLQTKALARTAAEPNDSLYPQQYALRNTGANQAWSLSRGLGVRIAVVDSGINTQHEDFSTTTFEPGWDYVLDSVYPLDANFDENGHGTHVAGIIAAGLNNKGIVGVAPQATLIPYRVFDASGSGSQAMVAAAVARAVENKVHIINMSLGGPHYSTILAAAVQQAIAAGVLVVAASGNFGITLPSYPAAFPGVVAVASSTRDDLLSYSSSQGDYVDLTAPGDNIISLDAGDNQGYLFKSGTSMATPFVSGALALLKQHFSTAGGEQLVELLLQTAAPAGPPGYDPGYGWGLVRPYQALRASIPPARPYTQLTLKAYNREAAIVEPVAVNIYTPQWLRLFTIHSYQGSAKLSLPQGKYYYSMGYYGHGSGLQAMELTHAKMELSFSFEVQLYTVATLDSRNGEAMDTVVEAYRYSTDPYNLLTYNDDDGSSLYSTLSVSRVAGERVLFRVRSYDGGAGDYLFYLSPGSKSLAARSLNLTDYSPLPDTGELVTVQPGIYYRGRLTESRTQQDFLLP